jgi:hypothetical protein
VRGNGRWGMALAAPLIATLLAFFASTALLGEPVRKPLLVSLDGANWTADLNEPLMIARQPWWPGQERSVVVYVHNASDRPTQATMSVAAIERGVAQARSPVAITLQSDEYAPVQAAAAGAVVRIGSIAPGGSRPVVVSARFDRPTAEVEALDDGALHFQVRAVADASTAAPQVVDMSGALLWMAPVLVVGGALMALWWNGRRRSLAWRGVHRGGSSAPG